MTMSSEVATKARTKLVAVGMEKKVNLVMIWILGLWDKKKAKVDVDFW